MKYLTLEEANRVTGFGSSGDLSHANELYDYVSTHKATDDRLWRHLWGLGAVYEAGKIEGIRKERARRRGERCE